MFSALCFRNAKSICYVITDNEFDDILNNKFVSIFLKSRKNNISRSTVYVLHCE